MQQRVVACSAVHAVSTGIPSKRLPRDGRAVAFPSEEGAAAVAAAAAAAAARKREQQVDQGPPAEALAMAPAQCHHLYGKRQGSKTDNATLQSHCEGAITHQPVTAVH
ncbi:hypothetical protein ANO11243_031100 [Dothideomycetidae sp. 11243]|nr:hypothetical protein ANO11243_031100 [fungal sp. No.11243]